MLLLLACARPAEAQGQPDAAGAAAAERRRVRVVGVEFTGVAAIDKGQLAGVLATRRSSRLPWGDKHYFSRVELRDDLRRVRAFYADRGYPRARVVSYDIKVGTGRETVSVTFHIEEGPPVRIASLSLFGFEVLPADARRLLESTVQIPPGTIRTRARLEAARAAGDTALKEQGYPYARVSLLEGAALQPLTVAVTLAAEPGRSAKFGPVAIVGNSSVSRRVIERQLAFGAGDAFQLSRVLESQRRLYNLELFQYVNFAVPDLAAQPAEVPVTATITEGKHRRVRLGLGYGSEELARAGVRWRHVNFFGGARTLGVEAKYSSLDQGVRVNLAEPYFFSPSYRFDASVQDWRSNELAYKLLTRGGRATVSREVLRRDPYGRRRSSTRAGLSIVDEFETYTITPQALADPTFRDELIALGLDPETSQGRGTLVALGLDLTHDTTDNLLDAHRGYLASLHIEQAATALGGDWSYLEATIESRHYWKLAGRALLATRARIGSIRPNGSTVETAAGAEVQAGVPFFKLYFLGGASSLRGWGRYEVSPLNAEGFPIGGQSTLEASTEVRFPIRGKISGVTFVEGGNVWADPWTFWLRDLRYDAGAGVRYLTPIGPLRFDVGYQLNPIPGLLIDGQEQRRRWRLHFSVGQAF